MLANYQILRRSDALIDAHRVAIAETYLGEGIGVRLLNYSPGDFERLKAVVRRSAADGRVQLDDIMAQCGPRSMLALAFERRLPGITGPNAPAADIDLS